METSDFIDFMKRPSHLVLPRNNACLKSK